MTSALPMNLVAVPHCGISPRTLNSMEVSADSRRRLRFRGSRREKIFRGILSPQAGVMVGANANFTENVEKP
jgi:hypothetical protein